MVVPDARFADLYFKVPAKRISGETTEFRLLPKGDTRYMNAFEIEVGTLDGSHGVVPSPSDGVR